MEGICCRDQGSVTALLALATNATDGPPRAQILNLLGVRYLHHDLTGPIVVKVSIPARYELMVKATLWGSVVQKSRLAKRRTQIGGFEHSEAGWWFSGVRRHDRGIEPHPGSLGKPAADPGHPA